MGQHYTLGFAGATGRVLQKSDVVRKDRRKCREWRGVWTVGHGNLTQPREVPTARSCNCNDLRAAELSKCRDARRAGAGEQWHRDSAGALRPVEGEKEVG